MLTAIVVVVVDAVLNILVVVTEEVNDRAKIFVFKKTKRKKG